jgi:LacI family transcriptional regulator
MNNKKTRIKDIAALAGVSVGTVDRVLHGRGKVSDEALQKVQQTLKQINYQPNLLARTLGSRKTYRIVALLPDPALDDYWAQSDLGIAQASSEWSAFDIQVDALFFDLYDVNSFKRAAQQIYQLKPDGILIAPVFYKETLPFFDFCKASNIPFVLFNTNIPEAAPLSFIGQNLYESGRVGAELMLLAHPGPGSFAIIHSVEDEENAIHLLQKEKGFQQYFQQKDKKAYRLLTVKLTGLTEDKINHKLETLLADPQLKGVFLTTSSGTSKIASFLERQNRKDIKLVGYDLLKENILHMQKGTIDFLINQNPKRQALMGIQHLANYLLLQKPAPATCLFPLEIITRENLNSYLQAISINC